MSPVVHLIYRIAMILFPYLLISKTEGRVTKIVKGLIILTILVTVVILYRDLYQVILNEI